MRRVVCVLAAMALALLLASGVALALTKIGTNGPDTLKGTNGNDNLLGKGANDRLFTLNGRDTLLGGPGKDWVDIHPTESRRGLRTSSKRFQKIIHLRDAPTPIEGYVAPVT
jgi:hypothetical protein